MPKRRKIRQEYMCFNVVAKCCSSGIETRTGHWTASTWDDHEFEMTKFMVRGGMFGRWGNFCLSSSKILPDIEVAKSVRFQSGADGANIEHVGLAQKP